MATSIKMSRARKAGTLGVIIGLLGTLLGMSGIGTTFERSVGLSWLFEIRGEAPPPAEVAIVAIDSRTGGQLGLPDLPREWPRSIHGQLVDALVRGGASAIVFDIQFDKPKLETDDLAFAASVDKSDRVALVEVITGKRQPITDANGRHTGSVWVEELIQPLPSLVDSAKGLGTFPLPKVDAAVYEFWVFKDSVGGAPTLPAVALQIHALKAYPEWMSLLQATGVPDFETLPDSAEDTGKAQQLRTLMRTLRRVLENDSEASTRLSALHSSEAASISSPQTQRLLNALIRLYTGHPQRYLNFYGPPGTITTLPYHAVVRGSDPNLEADALDFEGKTVFVGFSDLYDPGQPDRFYTVFTGEDGVDLSGVEIAATAFANLLTDRSIRPMDTLQNALILLVFGITMGTIAYLFPAVIAVPLTLIIAVLYVIGAQWLFNGSHLWIPLATPLLSQLPAALFLGLIGQYLLERRRGQHMSEAISYYLPENVARDLTEDRLSPDAFNKVVYSTCLATDMSGFSTIAEQLPPGELASFLNDYFDSLAEPLKRHQVDVTEFRADAIMCAWTAAQPEIEIRKKAVLAALDAGTAVNLFKNRHNMPTASLRIGLEAGQVYIGHAGGGGKFVFSIVGDCANTASRIEGLNKHIGTQILATDSVVDGIAGLLIRSLGSFQFVGKSEALPIVEVIAQHTSASQAQVLLTERFAETLASFHALQWKKAAAGFEQILSSYPEDGPARFYLARCRQYLDGAPQPDDPGVIRMQSK
jgi:adenylate cyclase